MINEDFCNSNILRNIAFELYSVTSIVVKRQHKHHLVLQCFISSSLMCFTVRVLAPSNRMFGSGSFDSSHAPRGD